MRTKDIEAGVAYATCDGVHVVPQSPVTGRHWVKRERDRETNTFVETIEMEEPPDPWGGCQKASRPPGLGVLVKSYQVDRDGAPIADTARARVIPARDITGTWTHYLTLYAETIRKRWDEKAYDAEISELHTRLAAAWRNLFGAKAHVYVHRSYSGVNRTRGLRDVELRIEINDKAQLEDFIAYLSEVVTAHDVPDTFAQLRDYLPEASKSDD